MFEKRCEGCPFLVELQQDSARLEQLKAAAIERYFDRSDQNEELMATDGLPQQTVRRLQDLQQKSGQNVDMLYGHYERLIELNQESEELIRQFCVTPYIIRRALLLGKKPAHCTSFVRLFDRFL